MEYRYDIDPEDDMPLDIDVLVAASKALIDINRGEAQPEPRDAVYFRRVYPTHKLIAERISLDATKDIRSTMRMLNKARNLAPLSSNQFGDLTEGMIAQHSLSMPLEEINPLQVVEQNRRITQMGPGGLPGSQSVGADAQAVQTSSFGFYSPVEGPESELAGVDMRLATGVQIGEDGRVYQALVNKRTGKTELVNPTQLRGKVVTFK